MALRNFREHLLTLSPRWLQGTLSGAWVGVVHGITADAIGDAVGYALRLAWVREDSVTVDALPLLGENFNLPAYPVETPAQHKERMAGAWDLWAYAGDESPIEDQLATLGFTGATVYTPDEWERPPLGYWSQFWLWLPAGSHPVTGPGVEYGGGANYGDPGLIYGPAGITQAELQTLLRVLRRWKPADWICREIIFEVSGASYGTGHTYNEAGLVYGGSAVTVPLTDGD